VIGRRILADISRHRIIKQFARSFVSSLFCKGSVAGCWLLVAGCSSFWFVSILFADVALFRPGSDGILVAVMLLLLLVVGCGLWFCFLLLVVAVTGCPCC